jgi:2-methylcitrate dehydratase PrpD
VANPRALECDQGFGPTHAGEQVNSALQGIGKEWLFETISHKYHACCHGLHAALEAQAQLLPIASNAVDRITVQTHPRWMTVCNQIAPETGLGAKFSYGTVLAMQILGHDTARLDSYSDAICADPAVQGVRARVQVIADDSLRETEAEVAVTTDGGLAIATHDLDAPMTIHERRERLQGKAASLVGEGLATSIWNTIEKNADPGLIGEYLATPRSQYE